MIIELKPHVDAFAFMARLERMGFQAVRQGERSLSIVRGMDKSVDPKLFTSLPEVESVAPLKEKFKLASRAVTQNTGIKKKGK